MISGAHVIVYSKKAEADRVFFRDVLQFASVDAGHGWLIFALPPAEAAVHPSDESGTQEIYFMCDDLKAEMASLAKKKVECSEVQEARWGSITKMRLPGGGEVASFPNLFVNLSEWVNRLIAFHVPSLRRPRWRSMWGAV